MKFLPSDAAVLSMVETPKRPLAFRPVAFPAYRTVYLRTIFDGRKP